MFFVGKLLGVYYVSSAFAVKKNLKRDFGKVPFLLCPLRIKFIFFQTLSGHFLVIVSAISYREML